jgi:nucleotide-binding universal stress UspA family protein
LGANEQGDDFMYTRMLVALDRSKVAEQALPYARFLAKSLTIPVELLEVVDPDALAVLSNPEQGRYLDRLLAEISETGKTYLKEIAKTFGGTHVEYSVKTGKPEEVIIERAAADNNTLIVMATHGRSGIQRWLLGSVTDKVLHGATNHMLLVRARAEGRTAGMATFTAVVVPLDGSALAERPLPYVVDLAKKMNLKVVLCRAYSLPPIAGNAYEVYPQEVIDQIEAEALDYLADKVKEMQQTGLENVASIVRFGSSAEEIIALARKTPDSFIAMCTHGRSGIKRWVLGSVTERAVRHSGDPVLIIRAA